jgi:hypothetical protein
LYACPEAVRFAPSNNGSCRSAVGNRERFALYI